MESNNGCELKKDIQRWPQYHQYFFLNITNNQEMSTLKYVDNQNIRVFLKKRFLKIN